MTEEYVSEEDRLRVEEHEREFGIEPGTTLRIREMIREAGGITFYGICDFCGRSFRDPDKDYGCVPLPGQHSMACKECGRHPRRAYLLFGFHGARTRRLFGWWLKSLPSLLLRGRML